MKRIHAFVSGEVQGVGYREEVKRLAFGLNIFGFVRNLEDGRVEIIAEGEDKSIEEFLDRINIKRYPIFVVDIEVEEESYKGEFKSFKVIRDKDVQKEMLSALSRGTVEIHEVKEILQGVKQDTSAMLEKQDLMLEKQDLMLEKQNLLIKVTEKGFGEMRSGFAEVKEEMAKGFGDMRQGFSEVKEEIHLLRDDFRELFMREVSELRSEIVEIKATLARMQTS
ncbi:acylphosphatase [groundwater metagenome]